MRDHSLIDLSNQLKPSCIFLSHKILQEQRVPVCEWMCRCFGHLLYVTVLCCSLEYHSHMVSDAVKRVIKQGKVSVCMCLTEFYLNERCLPNRINT